MKTIILDGRVGANGTEVKTTKSGKPFAKFSVANNTYVNGEEKTEWFDVISYDPTFIEKRAQYLGKGSYVIVTGNIRTEVNIDQANKVWINNYITATTIETPRLGVKSDATQTLTTVATSTTIPTTPSMTISTFTGGTKSELAEVTTPKQEVVAVASANAGVSCIDEELPF